MPGDEFPAPYQTELQQQPRQLVPPSDSEDSGSDYSEAKAEEKVVKQLSSGSGDGYSDDEFNSPAKKFG